MNFSIMDSVVKGLCRIRWQPQLQLIRCKTKVNVTRPRPPHFQRALVEKICLPYFSITKKRPKHIPNFDSCEGEPVPKPLVDESHPLISILAEDNLTMFQKSKLIAFFHLNAITPEEKFEAQLLIKKSGMKLMILNKYVLKKALTGTVYENVLSLFQSPTATAFGPEPDVYTLMKVQKKLHKLSLMAAIVENRFLSLSELRVYAELKNITDARVSLVSIMSSASQNLVQQLNCHPTNLVGLLNQHKQILQDGKS